LPRWWHHRDERDDFGFSPSWLTTRHPGLFSAAEMALPPFATVPIDRTILSGEGGLRQEACSDLSDRLGVEAGDGVR